MIELCSIDGCANPAFARGWCSKHYGRWRVHGDPLVLRRWHDDQPNRSAAELEAWAKIVDAYARAYVVVILAEMATDAVA